MGKIENLIYDMKDQFFVENFRDISFIDKFDKLRDIEELKKGCQNGFKVKYISINKLYKVGEFELLIPDYDKKIMKEYIIELMYTGAGEGYDFPTLQTLIVKGLENNYIAGTYIA
ncbi:hypothetical protein LZ906_017875 (plasmid) [Paraclostridium ghonii]|uniref:hypothetical protein n=1 Tax=Paraclostridium ghonii TaxID=29358 RepID=UPI00202CE80D|nr:hypothetical protein [Paeniclostridium ghonii]MCM0167415.1 hypothetical protein [Paeniclostridium ghonii]